MTHIAQTPTLVETAPAKTDPRPGDHPPVAFGRVGLLLVNLGTPDSPDYWSMRRYLGEFLDDPRVVEAPRLLWRALLQTVILSTRPFKSGAAYRSIWRDDADGSPLRYFTRRQSEMLGERLRDQAVEVDFAMRYGSPSIPDAIERLKARGCDRIVLFPLYPQYSATTTATVVDKAADALRAMRWQPAMRTVPPFHDDPAYIDALAESVDRQLSALDFEPQVVLLSFHGLPHKYLMKGDPYHCHCAKTARLLRERLGWAEERMRLTFQSRFGPLKWLQPYTDEVLKALPGEGVTRVAVATPGFVADCLETLEEIAMEGREEFLEAGGRSFAALSCLNDEPASLAMLEAIARRELAGWTRARPAELTVLSAAS